MTGPENWSQKQTGPVKFWGDCCHLGNISGFIQPRQFALSRELIEHFHLKCISMPGFDPVRATCCIDKQTGFMISLFKDFAIDCRKLRNDAC